MLASKYGTKSWNVLEGVTIQAAGTGNHPSRKIKGGRPIYMKIRAIDYQSKGGKVFACTRENYDAVFLKALRHSLQLRGRRKVTAQMLMRKPTFDKVLEKLGITEIIAYRYQAEK